METSTLKRCEVEHPLAYPDQAWLMVRHEEPDRQWTESGSLVQQEEASTVASVGRLVEKVLMVHSGFVCLRLLV